MVDTNVSGITTDHDAFYVVSNAMVGRTGALSDATSDDDMFYVVSVVLGWVGLERFWRYIR